MADLWKDKIQTHFRRAVQCFKHCGATGCAVVQAVRWYKWVGIREANSDSHRRTTDITTFDNRSYAMPDGTLEQTTPTPEAAAPVPAAPHCVISIDAHVLTVADTCFEVFTRRELLQSDSVLQELISSYPGVSIADLKHAISLALNWKRQLSRASKRIH